MKCIYKGCREAPTIEARVKARHGSHWDYGSEWIRLCSIHLQAFDAWLDMIQAVFFIEASYETRHVSDGPAPLQEDDVLTAHEMMRSPRLTIADIIGKEATN